MINKAEAELVRQIYQRYPELGSVRLLKAEPDQHGVSSKIRRSVKGTKSGGKSSSRGALYELLSNPVYVGEIRHERECQPGQHQPILERAIWQQVQQRLRNATRRDHEPTSKAPLSPLAGKVVDEPQARQFPPAIRRDARFADWLLERSGFELPRPVIAAVQSI